MIPKGDQRRWPRKIEYVDRDIQQIQDISRNDKDKNR